MTVLTEQELAARWNVKPGTIRKWRKERRTPKSFRVGVGRNAGVRYRIEDVVAWERRNLKEG